jgi:hypothetical protein
MERGRPLVEAERDQLALVLPVDEVAAVLHRRERGRAGEPRGVLGLRELPGRHRRGAEIADFPGADDVVQRTDRLLDRRRGVPAVDLVEVDVVDSEPPQGRIDAVQDVLA